jgi:glyoxylase-like metal-dependent hydrolase (beta-lactamase superfamily II)
MDQVVPGLWRIPLARATVNAYVLQDQDGLTLVDSGYAGCHRHILEQLAEAGFSPQDVQRIIVTHGDLDHMGSAAALRASTGALVLAHALEVELVERRQPRSWGRCTAGRLAQLGYRALLSTGLAALPPAKVDRALADGETLRGGWQVLHTPGHTPGHISIFHPSRRVLLTGDILGQRLGRLIGPTPAYATDMSQATASVAKLASLRPRILCFGHLRPLQDIEFQALPALATRLQMRYGMDRAL